MELQSRSFRDEQPLPTQYTCEGENLSPPLEWRGEPAATQQFALLLETAPPEGREPFVLWLVYNLPPDVTNLPAGWSRTLEQAATETTIPARHGRNSNENVGYDGPWGTPGTRERLRFRLFALDQPLDLPEGLTKDQFLQAIEGHVLEESRLDTTYESEAAA